MQQNHAEPPSVSDFEQLRHLARLVAEATHEDPDQLDALALLATRRAFTAREAQYAARAGRIARINATISDIPTSAVNSLPDTTLAAIEVLLDQAAAQASRQQHFKTEMLAAAQIDEYDRIRSLADAAQAALVASNAALQQARDTLQIAAGSHEHAPDLQPAPSSTAALKSEPPSSSALTVSPNAIADATFDIARDNAPEVAEDTTSGILLFSQPKILSTPPRHEAPLPPALTPVPSPHALDTSLAPPEADRVWTALREERLGLAYALVAAGALGAATPAVFVPTLKLVAAALIADGTRGAG